VQEIERSLILKCVFIMETKEFTREQLDVLAGLVLAEMGCLREFGNAHGEAVRQALEPEIVSLYTLYNYLIA
jgi:hypothetical protein